MNYIVFCNQEVNMIHQISQLFQHWYLWAPWLFGTVAFVIFAFVIFATILTEIFDDEYPTATFTTIATTPKVFLIRPVDHHASSPSDVA